jgi:hypothetical protein
MTSKPEVNCRKQALAQLCTVCSPMKQEHLKRPEEEVGIPPRQRNLRQTFDNERHALFFLRKRSAQDQPRFISSESSARS